MRTRKDEIRNLYDLRADGRVRCPVCHQTRAVGGLTRARDRGSRAIVTIVICDECGIGIHARQAGLTAEQVRELRASMLSALTIGQDERISGHLAQLRTQAAVQGAEPPVGGAGVSPEHSMQGREPPPQAARDVAPER